MIEEKEDPKQIVDLKPNSQNSNRQLQAAAVVPAEDLNAIGFCACPKVLEAGSRLIPLVDWPKYHPWPPLGGLRHMVFQGKQTGFAKVIKKCGRRLLIDEKKFFEFVEMKNAEREAVQ